MGGWVRYVVPVTVLGGIIGMWMTRGAKLEENRTISAHEERLETLERTMKGIKLEWEDAFDRLNRMMGRLNARIRKNEALEGPRNEAEEAGQGVASPLPDVGTHAMLATMRQRRGGK